MINQGLKSIDPGSTPRPVPPLASVLLDHALIPARPLVGAMAEAGRLDVPLHDVIAAEALVPAALLRDAQARRHGSLTLTLAENPPEAAALARLPVDFCLQHRVLAWRHIGDTLVIATARPDSFARTLAALPADIGPTMMALCTEQDIHDVITRTHGAALARAAETARDPAHSCRDLNHAGQGATMAAGVLALACGAALWLVPQAFFAAALGLALASLVVAQGLKVLALVMGGAPTPPEGTPTRRPVVSMLVPLHDEDAIAATLLRRLGRLSYPRALLDVLLVLEEGDTRTRDALDATTLPPWMRVVTVPPGPIRTKPRALNHALAFARGEIVGIWDAEDAPAPDQLDRVVAHFARAPPEVGCVQGILDFYNPRANWLSRCFAIEYASWFRVILPGLARCGLVLPLGGTTVFLRREALRATGGWDAHNVTEDADLGILLARKGFVTEVLPTVTREEANNRLWPWIKQRSRWLKGYALTWWVHTRHPARLWADLGAWRFFGVQAVFLVTVLQFALAPVLWSFWLIVFGLPHPLDPVLTQSARQALVAIFLSAEAVSILVGLVAVSRSPHAGLMPWVPTLFAYFPLGTFALYKGLWELLRRPFHWDKTQHGRSGPDAPDADLPPDP